MIVCKECGHHNEAGDQFCGSCGVFLEWSGEKIQEDSTESSAEHEEAERLAAEEAARAEAEAQERAKAERAERKKAEARARAEAEARENEEAERKAREDAEERAKLEAAAKAQAEAEARDRKAAERKARAELKTKAREASEAVGTAEAEQKAAERAAAEERVRQEAEASAKAEAEAREREEAERKAREEAEAKAKAEKEARKRAAAEKKKKQEAEQRAREEAEAKARAEKEAAEAEARRRRAAAMVAKPQPTRKEPRPPSASPAKNTSPPASAPAAPSDLAAASATPPISDIPAEAPVPSSQAESSASQAEAKQPIALKPAAPRRRRAPAVMEPPTRELKPGDLICGECGEGNEPSRKFCRRCGTALVEAVVVETPWWKKIFRREKKPIAAGERPFREKKTRKGRIGSRLRTVFRIVLIVAVLLIAVGMIGPWRNTVLEKAGGVVSTVRRTVSPKYEPVRPVAAEATSSLPDHPPIAAIDQLRNTYWAEGAPGKGEGQTLTLTFDVPVDIARVGFTIGASKEPEQYVAQPRPKEIHLVFSDGSTSDVTLKDEATFQQFEVDATQVTKVEIHIVSVFGSIQGENCALAEAEFFTKK